MSWLLVIQIERGKNFRAPPGFNSMYVSVRFNGTRQHTDQLKAAKNPHWSTDIIWEISDDELKKFRTSQSIKIDTFACKDSNMDKKKRLGYLVIPFKQIRMADKLCSWKKLLGSSLGVPEIKLRTRVVSSEDYYKELDEFERGGALTPAPGYSDVASAAHKSPFQTPQQQQQQLQRLTMLNPPENTVIMQSFNLLSEEPVQVPRVSVIHASAPSQEEKVYPTMIQLGEPDYDKDMEFKISVSIEAIHHLSSLFGNRPRNLYAYYELFDIQYKSTSFDGVDMPREYAEKKTYFVRSSAENLVAYFCELPVSVYVCTGDNARGVVDVEISRLVQNWLSHDCGVAQALEESFPIQLMPEQKKVRGLKQLSPRSKQRAHPMMRVMIEMELLPGSRKPIMSPTALLTSPILSHSGGSSMFSPGGIHMEKLNFTAEETPDRGKPGDDADAATVAVAGDEENGESMSLSGQVRPVFSDTGPGVIKRFRITIDVTGLKAIDPVHVLDTDVSEYLASTQQDVWMYCRFEYPLLFGTTHIFTDLAPYITDQRVITEPAFTGGLYSFEFAMDEKNLAVALAETTLGVEVWRSVGPERHESTGLPLKGVSQSISNDKFIGIASIPLNIILGDGLEDTRHVDSRGHQTFKIEEQYFSVLPHRPKSTDKHQKPRVAFVKVNISLIEQGELNSVVESVSQEEVKSLWETLGVMEEELRKKKRQCDRLQKKLDTAAFEADMNEHQEQKVMDTVKENYEKMMYAIIQKYDSDLDKQKMITQNAMQQAKEYHEKVLALEKESEMYREKLKQMNAEKAVAAFANGRNFNKFEDTVGKAKGVELSFTGNVDKENAVVATPPSAKRKLMRRFQRSVSHQQLSTGLKL